jgi:phage tail protein X/uncharacterized protein (UPF0333 family)
VDRGKDRSLIYILITLLVLILLIAISVIIYMGMKMMDMQNNQAQLVKRVQEEAQSRSANMQEQVNRAVAERMRELKPQLKSQQEQKSSGTLKREEIAAIVGIVMAQMQQQNQTQKVKKEEKKDGSDITLDSELRKVVDGESNGTATDTANGTVTAEDDDELESVLTVLESVDVEDENSQDVSIDSLELDKIEAKEGNPKEGQDTFNKVVVEDKKDGRGEIAELGGEIEQLLDKSKKVVKESEYEKEMKKEIKERRNEMRIIVVRRGDTLSLIAKRAYGSGKERYYKKILRANPGLIKNPNRIFVGQRLRVPK